MGIEKNSRLILPGLCVNPKADWRTNAGQLDALDITEAALLFKNTAADERRELYRALERTGLKSIPYVHLQSDMEEWELEYLVTTYATAYFGCRASDTSYGFIATLPNYTSKILIENPARRIDLPAFSDEALTRTGTAGVCLDLGALEIQRLTDRASYEAAVRVLDHHPVLCSQISAVPASWYRRWLRLARQQHVLESLSELHYLKQVPASYLAPLVIIELDNTLEEQLEIQRYLSFLLTK